MTYAPQHLKLWERPGNYAGAEWGDYYVFLGQTRDSDILTRSNFDVACKNLRPEGVKDAISAPETQWTAAPHEMQPDSVLLVSSNHWAVGWCEFIAIHKSDTAALQAADDMAEEIENYPVLDEEHFSNMEQEEADDVWSRCYEPSERIEYIRENRSQFDFRDLQDLFACVRGKYFAGYASELLY